ncbi:hypothetical protein HHI36_006108 [Cryptolaemus montrouzieri]|uniref:Uncharacterized protein n=1 Tax=Cryptolaemus montrouzieri TaxID=559131 RepID=A0ABD2NXK1_9CUCU
MNEKFSRVELDIAKKVAAGGGRRGGIGRSELEVETIGVLHTYLNLAEPTRKFLKSAKDAAAEFALEPKDSGYRQKISTICGYLKQKKAFKANMVV